MRAALVTNSQIVYLYAVGVDKAALAGTVTTEYLSTLSDVPDDVAVGYIWDGVTYSPPVTQLGALDPETYSTIVTEAIQAANELISRAVTAESTDRAESDANLQAQISNLTKSIPVQVDTSTSYDIVEADRGKLLTFSNASAVAVALPQAGGTITDGWYVWITNLGAGTVTVTPSVSTLNGAASLDLATDETLLAISNGSNYFGAFISSGGVSSIEGRSGAVQFQASDRASSALNIDSVTTHGDSDYTILSTDRVVVTSAALTAARTWTLPAASAVNAGQILVIADQAQGITASNTLTIARAGSDTINGAATLSALNSAGTVAILWSDGTSKWTALVINQMTATGRAVATAASASAARTALGVVIGTDVQAYDAELDTIKGLKPGLMLPHGGATAAPGTLLCDGSAYSRTTYADLFAAIGTYWGAGDGVNTFNVPDTRGEFFRGLDNGRGVDSGRALGSWQDATRHPYLYWNSTPALVGPSNYSPVNADSTSSAASRTYTGSGATTSGTQTQYYTARPRNVAVNFCIVY